MAAQSGLTANDDNDDIPTVRELKLLANNLHSSIKESTLIPEGFGKLKRKVLKEYQHLQTLDENTTYNSSNIHYLNSIWQTIVSEGANVCGVFKKYKYKTEIESDNTEPKKFKNSELIVDIVCDDGLRWIKVKTSNPYSMQLQFLNYGMSAKGKNIVTMADNFLCASNQHKTYFQAPKIQFVFVEGITSDIAYILKQKCICVKGQEIKDSDFLYVDDGGSSTEESETELKVSKGLDESCVNLGVRTMLTMISALSNHEINTEFFNELTAQLRAIDAKLLLAKQSSDGKLDRHQIKEMIRTMPTNNLDFEYCDFPNKKPFAIIAGEENNTNKLNANGQTLGHKSEIIPRAKNARPKRFSDKSYEEKQMLLQMFSDELECAVLPNIEKCIKGKKLLCCEAAWNHFMDIVNLSAGAQEWQRCCELQKRVTIVKNEISARTHGLKGKTMSHINKCVFGTGDSLQCITLTAIASFVRKAEQQSVKYFVHIHPVRPLTERYQCEYEKKRKLSLKSKKNGIIITDVEQKSSEVLLLGNDANNINKGSEDEGLLDVD